jgi:hypothetical protein
MVIMKKIICFFILLAFVSCGLSDQEKHDILLCAKYQHEIVANTKTVDSINQAISRLETRYEDYEIKLLMPTYSHYDRLNFLSNQIYIVEKISVLEQLKTYIELDIQITKMQINLYK